MSDDFGNRDSHLEALEKLKSEVGPSEPARRAGGYFSQNEYATRIYYWAGEEHEPDEIDGIIATLANCGWARTPERELPVAGTVLAFCELYKDKAESWRRSYPLLFRKVAFAIEKPAQLRQWNDFYIATWFVLRRARREDGIEIIDKLLDRVAEGGTVRYDALEAMSICARQCKPFEVAWQRAAHARSERMLLPQ